MAYGILIIEDEETLARNIATFLTRDGFDVRTAGTAADGMDAFESFGPDLVLLDHQLPDGTGIEILKQIQGRDGGTLVVVLTGHGNMELAVEAMREGAVDFLTKPVALAELNLCIRRALSLERETNRLAHLENRRTPQAGIEAILGESISIKQTREQIGRLLRAELALENSALPSVLIAGETGTGKELVARAIHLGGPRRDKPIVALNCAALPRELVESELFGHERGAFTDARERRVGLVEAADGGTLFLDEIADMDIQTQAKLLRVLEDHSVRRIGSTREIAVDVRVIAATHLNLEDLIAQDRFRADLYFRLRTVQIDLPALRDRDGDAQFLAKHFLQQTAARYGKPDIGLAPESLAAIGAYDWPGNIRELRNVIEHAVLLSEENDIQPATLRIGGASADALPPVDGLPMGVLPEDGIDLDVLERNLVRQALERTGGKITAAAKLLGLTRDTMRYRIEKHGLK